MSLKKELLELFELNRGTVFSGTSLAERFGVSRNAVWKAVNSLKEDGHQVVSDGKKGYLMMDSSDRLSAEGVRSHLPESLKDININVFDSVDSTNVEAGRIFLSQKQGGVVVIAEQQYAGRTRKGSRFYSPYGTGLYISLIIPVRIGMDKNEQIVSDIASVVHRAIKDSAGADTVIRPPCDLYLAGKKVCGMLIEGNVDLTVCEISCLTIGIGVNVTTEDFPDEIKENVASLGTAAVRCRLAAEIIRGLYGSFGLKGADV